MMQPFYKLFYLALISLLIFSLNSYAQNVLKVEANKSIYKVDPNQKFEIILKISIKSPYHINSIKPNEDYLIPAKLSLENEKESGFKLTDVKFPVAKDVKFEFSDVPVSAYEGIFNVKASIIAPSKIINQTINLSLKFEYQACDNSTCLPPAEELIKIVVNSGISSSDTSKTNIITSNETDKTIDTTTKTTLQNYESKIQKDDSSEIFDEENLIYSLIIVFLMGLALNFTPCVYPLIMITIGYFGNQSESKTSRLFLLSLMYVLGISITYSTVGVVTSLTGSLFGEALQNPIVILFVVAVLLIMSLSMFGLYEIQPPTSIMNKIGGFKSGMIGSLFMGLTMGIVAAPCVGPFVIGLITFIGAKGDVFLGFLIFFILSLGLGSPYLLLGIFSGKIKALPKSGEWMIGVKKIFGFILVSMSIYFALPLLPEEIANYLLPAAVIIFSLYLLFLDKSGMTSKGFRYFKIVFLTLIIMFSIYSLIPDSSNTINWQKPNKIDFIQNGKPAFLDFYADWCIPCKELDKLTFSDNDIIDESTRFQNFKIDITKSTSDISKQFIQKYNIKGVPTLIIIDSNGKEIKRITGFISAKILLVELKKVN